MTTVPTPESTTISHFTHDEQSGLLTVRFHNGANYAYQGVPVELAKAFQMAPSKGQFLAKEIRPRYRHTKING